MTNLISTLLNAVQGNFQNQENGAIAISPEDFASLNAPISN
jgi:hypothetical protein